MSTVIPYGRQWIDEDDIAAVVAVLRSELVTQGPAVPRFEEQLARQCGARFAVAVSSGTAALHCAYAAAGLGQGDDFVTTPMTFAATANAGIYCGARPVFADISPDTGNIDPVAIERAITDRTRMIAPVHFAGHPADMAAIRDIARRHGLKVVADACHALGARINGRSIGAGDLADMTVLSFHPVKHITTGEGGAILTDDEPTYNRLTALRSHGIMRKGFHGVEQGAWYHEMQMLGWNYRLTDMQAALGTSQLAKLARFVERRRAIWKTYGDRFANNPHFETPVERDNVVSSWHLYPIRLNDPTIRRTVFDALRAAGIGVQVHYIPVYRHPFYHEMGYPAGLCPVAEGLYAREISLPLYPAMLDKDVETVAETVLKVMAACGGHA